MLRLSTKDGERGSGNYADGDGSVEEAAFLSMIMSMMDDGGGDFGFDIHDYMGEANEEAEKKKKEGSGKMVPIIPKNNMVKQW